MVTAIVAAAALAGSVGCTGTGAATRPTGVRPAADAPDRFLVGSWESADTAEPSGDAACSSPMVDPRDGTRLRLVRSSDGEGDYEVPPGRYGVGPGESLRLDCRSGRPVGVVALTGAGR
ncbi:MAG TPA: hypothetical protein VLT32_14680 [Candidatus Sulfomarinibacteraceae bacterium]|nr:hypothetical protein [Candidatus Sulfomarinibacteraceae bacterium]